MQVLDISLTSAVSVALATVSTYSFSDPIDLTRKWMDGKNLSLSMDISTSAVSGQVDVIYTVCHSINGNYRRLEGAGTTLVDSGTSLTGPMGNGRYFVPLTYKCSTVTEWLRAVPFIKFGVRALHNTSPVTMHLCVG